jgi:hypothetical protein
MVENHRIRKTADS